MASTSHESRSHWGPTCSFSDEKNVEWGPRMLSNMLPSGKLSHITMENHHFWWVNQLFQFKWPFSIAFCMFTRGYSPGSCPKGVLMYIFQGALKDNPQKSTGLWVEPGVFLWDKKTSIHKASPNDTGWWFGTWFVFPYIYIGNNHPNWLSYFFQRGWNHQPGYYHLTSWLVSHVCSLIH